MDTLFDEIMGPPRRRSYQTKKPSTVTPSHSAPKVPTQAVLPKKTLPGSFEVHDTTKDIKTANQVQAPAEVPLPPQEPAETIALQEAGWSDFPAPAELPPATITAEAEEKSATEELDTAALGEGEKVGKSIKGENTPPTLSILDPTPAIHSHSALLIGIAGPTASGKTVLAYLFSSILPPTTPSIVLHQNDFLVPKHFLIPDASSGYDSDCRDAVDFAALLRVLKYVKREGKLPSGYRTNQDVEYQKELASESVGPQVVEELKAVIADSGVLVEGQPVVIVTGFLLYHDAEVRKILDMKLFLRVRKEQARARRLGKPDYTGEGVERGFWKTRLYFDQTVWPNYVREHKLLFEDSDVERRPLFDLCEKLGILMQPELDMSVEQTLRWTATNITGVLQAEGPEHVRGIEHGRDIDPEISLLAKYEACDCCQGWLGRVRKVLYDLV